MAPRKKATCSYNFPHPMDNDYLVGHTETLNNFLNAWNNRENHPIHPVWMLTGPNGIGKATLAYKIAKMVYGNVGDFFIIDQDRNLDKDGKLKPDGKVISVYTVRAMIEKMPDKNVKYDVFNGICDYEILNNTDNVNSAAVFLKDSSGNDISEVSQILSKVKSEVRSNVENAFESAKTDAKNYIDNC